MVGALLLLAGAASAEDVAPTAPPTPIATVLQNGKVPRLRAGKLSDFQAELDQLYALNGQAPLWIKDGKPTAEALALVNSFDQAGDLGLDPADYEAEALRKWLASPQWTSAEEISTVDVALSLEAMRFLANVSMGRVDPRSLGFNLDVAPRRASLPQRVQQLAAGGNPKTAIAEAEPRLPQYKYLREALARYRQLAKDGATPPKLGFPAKFARGAHHKDIPALRSWLHALGDLKEIKPEAAASDVYDPDLVAAVQSFQKRHNLPAAGALGKETLAQLAVTPADRVQQIQWGLERLRWLPDDMGGFYLLANIPSFRLYGSRTGDGYGQHDLEMNVIVGQSKDGRRTPVFRSTMTEVIFHPYWNVPDSIAAKELVPVIQRNPGYLARNNLEIVSHFSPNASAHAPSAGALARLASGSLKLRMKPGPHNALGLVKFSFPNPDNIYFHSTPAKGLFQRARRDFSHGCVRVQEPAKLAEWVLSQQPEWSHDRIVAAMGANKEKVVPLAQPIPVYVFYSTVFADQDGRVDFFEDIYGHDKALKEALAKGFPYSPPKPAAPAKAVPVAPPAVSAGT